MQYNQELQKQTWYSCTIYTMLNIIKYDYWVELKIDWILKIVIYMEKIGALLPWGAYFAVIYPAMTKLISYKTWLNLKVKKSSISVWLDNKSMWGLWFKKSSRLYKDLANDWVITKKDYYKISKHSKWYWHNHAVKQGNNSKKWTFLETLGWLSYTVSLKDLQYAQKIDLYYDPARTLIPWDERTKRAQKKLIKMAEERKEFISYEEFLNIDFK
jgi:hypothetical protein